LNLNIAFDIGVYEEEVLEADYIFVTHGHTDHIGGLIAHAHARAAKGNPAHYYVPLEICDDLHKLLKCHETLGSRKIGGYIHGVRPGDEISLAPNITVKVYRTEHRVPSQGYSILRQIDGEQIVEISYTGDTLFECLKNEETFWKAKKAIMEMTYLDGTTKKAKEYSHCHIQEVAENANLFACDRLIMCHISGSYANCKNILELVSKTIPPSLIDKVDLCLRSFGSTQSLTSVSKYVNGELSQDCTDVLQVEKYNPFYGNKCVQLTL